MIDFPNTPRIGQIHREAGSSFRFSGTAWDPIGLRSTDIEDGWLTARQIAATNSGTINQVLERNADGMTWITLPFTSTSDTNYIDGLQTNATLGSVTVNPGHAIARDGTTLMALTFTSSISGVADNEWIWLVQNSGTGQYPSPSPPARLRSPPDSPSGGRSARWSARRSACPATG